MVLIEEFDIDDIEFGEAIEEKEPNYRDGYIRGIYRARNIIDSKQKEIERLNNKEEQLIRRLEDLIIVGEQVENEWAVDICKMIIEELKGSNKQ